MVWLSIAAFLVCLFIYSCIISDNTNAQVRENESAKKEERTAEKIQLNRGEKTICMLCVTLMVGIFIYWVKNITLVPIIEMYTETVDMGMLFLAIVLGLICVDYICAVTYQLPTAPFLAIAFVLNCALAVKAPIVSMAIVFILTVCVYGVINSNALWITVLESALLKAMMGTSIILTILNLIGIIPSIIIILLIMTLTTSISITIEVVIWKKTGSHTIVVDAHEVQKSNFPMIIAHGMVPYKR